VPTRWRFALPDDPGVAATSYDQLHGLACRFFGCHPNGGEAPFAVTPPACTDQPPPGWTLALTWLTDQPSPQTGDTTHLQLGRMTVPVLS